jgi:hypothetical protein
MHIPTRLGEPGGDSTRGSEQSKTQDVLETHWLCLPLGRKCGSAIQVGPPGATTVMPGIP